MSNRKRLFQFLSCLVFASSVAVQTADAAATDYDELPIPVKSVVPAYPPDMLRDKVSGVVMVRVQINENGDVIERSVSKSTRAEFDEAAMEAVVQWKFKPARKDGVTVKATVTIPIRFNAEG